jgi:hypothetical protein
LGRLLKETPLTFARYGESDTDDNGYEIEGAVTPFEAEGSLQPLGAGDAQRVSADGVDAYSAYYYYTRTQLRSTDEEARTTSDTTVIDGRKYEVFDTGDWNKTVLRNVAHYKAILVRVSKKYGN